MNKANEDRIFFYFYSTFLILLVISVSYLYQEWTYRSLDSEKLINFILFITFGIVVLSTLNYIKNNRLLIEKWISSFEEIGKSMMGILFVILLISGVIWLILKAVGALLRFLIGF